MKTIHVSTELEQKIVAFCDDELNYHINESDCAGEYASEIEAQIALLRLLGHEDIAKDYEKQFVEVMDDYNDKREENEEIIKKDTEVLLNFIEKNLKDFVGFDPYADTDGYDLRSAWDEKETYVYSLSDETIATLADEIRERSEDFYCEEGTIVDRRIRETEKEAENNKEHEEMEQ